MREANTHDFSLLILLAIIWGSSFFNIKIATYSYEPITLALVRVIFASIPLLILCKIKRIKIEAFSKKWKWYALIGLFNIAIPFVLIAIGTSKINSYLAAILMSTTPLSGSILAHIFTKDENGMPKISYIDQFPEPKNMRQGNFLQKLSDSLEESGNKIITELPVGSMIVANNHFWLHGRKPFKENKNLSRELLRIRGQFN